MRILADVAVTGGPGVKPVTHGEVLKAFNANLQKLREFITKIVGLIPRKKSCICSGALEGTPAK